MSKFMKWLWPLAVGMTLVMSGCGGGSSSNPSSDPTTNGGTPDDDQNPSTEEKLTVVSVLPADGSIGVELNAVIYATFSKEMNPSTLNDAVYLTTDGTTHVDGNMTYASKILSFVPAANLEANATYQFVITTGVATTLGEHLENTHTTSFTTGDALLGAPSAVGVSLAPAALTVDSEESEALAPATGALLGTPVQFSALQWQSLADAEIGFDALLAGINSEVGAVTLNELLQSSLSLDTLLGTLSGLLNEQGATQARSLVEQLRTAVNGAGFAALPVQLDTLLQLPAGMGDMSVEDVVALLQDRTGGVSTLSLLSTMNSVVEPIASQPVEMQLALSPLLESSIKAQTIAPPAVTILAEGESAHSSATRAYMNLSVGGADISALTDVLSGITGTVTNSTLVNSLLNLTGGLLGILGINDPLDLGDHLDPAEQSVTFPLYLELGSAEAQVTQLTVDTVDMNVTTGLARLYIGQIDENLFFTQESLDASDFEPVEVLNVLGLISVTAKGYAVAESNTQAMHFLPVNELQTQTSFNPAGTNVDTLLASLLANLDLQVTLLGITIDSSDISAVKSALQGVFDDTLMPIAGNLLNIASDLLGVYVGSAEVSLVNVIEE